MKCKKIKQIKSTVSKNNSKSSRKYINLNFETARKRSDLRTYMYLKFLEQDEKGIKPIVEAANKRKKL